MTVGELIYELQKFNEDDEIYIGEYQNYGTDFAYSLRNVETNDISSFFDNDIKSAPILVMGSQLGAIMTESEVDWL